MREDHGAQAGGRPDLDAAAREGETARLFLCALCRARVLICRRCDRGQVYCAGGCAVEARRASLRRAGAAYQRSRRGRFAHAMRARRWRARAKNVTHQGSAGPTDTALLSLGPPARVAEASATGAAQADADQSPPAHPTPGRTKVGQGEHRCHACGRPVSPFVRQGFLRRRRVHPIPPTKGQAHGRLH